MTHPPCSSGSQPICKRGFQRRHVPLSCGCQTWQYKKYKITSATLEFSTYFRKKVKDMRPKALSREPLSVIPSIGNQAVAEETVDRRGAHHHPLQEVLSFQEVFDFFLPPSVFFFTSRGIKRTTSLDN